MLQEFLHAVAAGTVTVPVHRRYALDDFREAHADMESDGATGKLVVVNEGAECPFSWLLP